MGRIDEQMYLQDLEKLLWSILTVDERNVAERYRRLA